MRTDRSIVFALVVGSVVGFFAPACGSSVTPEGTPTSLAGGSHKAGTPLAQAPKKEALVGEWVSSTPTGTQSWKFLSDGRFSSNTDLGEGTYRLANHTLTLQVWRETERAYTTYTYSLYVDGDSLIFPAALRTEGRVELIGSWMAESGVKDIVQDITEQRSYEFGNNERFTEVVSHQDGNRVANEGSYRKVQGDQFVLIGTRGEMRVRSLEGLAFGAAPDSEFRRR